MAEADPSSDSLDDDRTLWLSDEQGRIWQLPLSSSVEGDGDAVTFWRAAPPNAERRTPSAALVGLSAADEVELVAHFGADPGVFMREHFSAAELRRLAFARWRLGGRDAANRQEWLPSA